MSEAEQKAANTRTNHKPEPNKHGHILGRHVALSDVVFAFAAAALLAIAGISAADSFRAAAYFFVDAILCGPTVSPCDPRQPLLEFLQRIEVLSPASDNRRPRVCVSRVAPSVSGITCGSADTQRSAKRDCPRVWIFPANAYSSQGARGEDMSVRSFTQAGADLFAGFAPKRPGITGPLS